jgi:hypothetical protein
MIADGGGSPYHVRCVQWNFGSIIDVCGGLIATSRERHSARMWRYSFPLPVAPYNKLQITMSWIRKFATSSGVP